MANRDEFTAALIDGDYKLAAKLYAAAHPAMPVPDDEAAEIQMHVARTSSQSIPLLLRAWSHRWLIERSLPSLLPDHLRPSAEQMCPKVVPTVGFAWGSSHLLLQPARPLIEGAVHARINELDADGMLVKDPALVKREMLATKDRTMTALFGRIDALLKEATAP